MIPSGWTLRRTVDPAFEPLTLAEAKAQVRVDPDITDSDAVLTELIGVAREMAEDFTKRAWIDQTWRLTLPCFPIIERWWTDQIIRLPRAPLIEVVSFKYRAWDGTLRTMTAWDGVSLEAETIDKYWVNSDDEPPAIEPPFGSFWPIARPQAGSVEIIFRAGYLAPVGSPPVENDTSAVPRKARQAMRMLLGHFFENRESVIDGPRWNAIEVPYSFERALDSLRIYGDPTR